MDDISTAALERLRTEPLNPVTDADVQAYRRDGVVCLRGVFDADWCALLHEAAMAAMDSGRGRVREPKVGQGAGRFYSSVYQSDEDPRIGWLRDRSPAPGVAARLMDADSVRFYYDQLFIKAPGTAAPTPWHNDLPFWPFQGNDLISLWIALTPVSRATSGVQYVAGSQHWNRMYQAVTPDYDPRFMDPAMPACPDYGDGSHDEVRVLSWDMAPGDVLCHHPLTVHGAAGNASATQWRVGLSIRYLGRDVRWDPRPHTMTLRRSPAVRAGEFPADDQALPVVWTAARGLTALSTV